MAISLADVVPSHYRRGEDKTLDFVLAQHAEIADLKRQLAEVKMFANKSICAACLEMHPYGTPCPPYEMRTTGQQWFRDKITKVQMQLAASRERERHYRNRIWLAMTDIANGQSLRAYDVLKALSDEVESVLRETESETSEDEKREASAVSPVSAEWAWEAARRECRLEVEAKHAND